MSSNDGSDFRPTDQAARNEALDPRRHVALFASAGTGKTTVLVKRYIALLANSVNPRNILALTFTRKAAQEMKDRIIARLAQPEIRAKIPGTIDLSDLQVSTIDAFTLGLVREFPLDAGMAPGVEIIHDDALGAVRAEAARRVLSGATGFDAETIVELPLLLDARPSDLEWAIVSYLDRRLAWRNAFQKQVKEAAGERAAFPVLRDELSEVRDEIARLVHAGRFGMPLPARMALEGGEQDASADALDVETLKRFFAPNDRVAKTPKGMPGWVGKDHSADFRRVGETVLQAHRRWRNALNDMALNPFWSLLQAGEEEYRRLKTERGLADFDDLAVAATELLGKAGEFSESRFRLEARYHHLLLDEFHDTSDVQWRLIQSILHPWTAGEGLTHEEVRNATGGKLNQPTFFFVGDPKQSIYGFRDARVEILQTAQEYVREKLDPGGSRSRRPVVLRWNFRSTRRLRRFFNAAAKGMSEEEKEDVGPEFLFALNDMFPEEEGPADAGDDAERPALAVAVAEQDEVAAAARVATRIRSLCDAGTPLDEIAVLSRTRAGLPACNEALGRLGIPTYLFSGASFFQTSEVLDVAALCRYLARPTSDRRAAELLRSRFFAAPADALWRLKREWRGDATPFATLLSAGGDAARERLPETLSGSLLEAAETVPGWVKTSRQLPPADAVARILAESRYADRIAAGADPGNDLPARRRAANVKKALQLLRGASRDPGATMERVAARLGTAGSGRDSEATVQASGAVQLLTIHAAKGLEFDHVFLVDMGRRAGADHGIPRVREAPDGRIHIGIARGSDDWKRESGGREGSDERRALYVAMTRARKSLTLSWTTRFTKDDAPYKPAGLLSFVPKTLHHAASMTARTRERHIEWDGHEFEVLLDEGNVDSDRTGGAEPETRP